MVDMMCSQSSCSGTYRVFCLWLEASPGLAVTGVRPSWEPPSQPLPGFALQDMGPSLPQPPSTFSLENPLGKNLWPVILSSL